MPQDNSLQEPPTLKLPSRRAENHRRAEIVDLTGKIEETGRRVITGFRSELAAIAREKERLNTTGLQGLVDGLFANQDMQQQPYTLAQSNAYVPITLNRILLSYSYMTQGLLGTLVDQPVEDAFRGGVNFKSAELDDEDLALLNRRFRRKQSRFARNSTPISRVNVNAGYDLQNSDLEAIKSVGKWSRLFGGAGLIVNTDQDFRQPLRVDAIREDSPLSFIAADRWELLLSQINIYDERIPTPFNYYGLDLHRSRVCKMLGKEAPSYIRLRLQGWGMSILEDSIKAVNAYIKFETLMFELLDEAKVDVYKIKGFNTSLSSDAGMERVNRRILLANQLKNYQGALSMDSDDDYIQKQLTFTGIAEIKDSLRTDLCAYLKFPRNKLFGESTSGFGSGKDSLDNYNSTIGNLRENLDPLVDEAGELRCQQMFGFVPEDLEHEWEPLAVLDGKETEEVKTSQQKRITERFSLGLTTGEEAMSEMRRMDLLDIPETEIELGLRDVEPPPTQNPEEVEGQQKHAEKLADKKTRGATQPR